MENSPDIQDAQANKLFLINIQIECVKSAIATLDIIHNSQADEVSKDMAIGCVLRSSYSALENIDNVLNPI